MNDHNNLINIVDRLPNRINEMFMMVDNDLNIVSFNSKTRDYCHKYLNRHIETGMPVFDITASEKQDATGEMFAGALAGQTVETEYTIHTADEGDVYFSTLLMPIFSAAKTVDGVFITIRDITEKVNTQKNIQFDSNNLAALINNIPGLMWSVDRGYKIITFNSAFEEVVAYMSGHPVSKGDNALLMGFGEDQNDRFKKYYDRAFAGETFTETIYSTEPSEYWSEVSFYPIREGDNVIGTACFSHDITPAKKADEKLANSELRCRALVENSHDGIILVDEDMKLIYSTSSTKRILGYSPEALIGSDLAVFVHPGDLDALMEKLAPLMASYGQTITATYRMKHKNGSRRVISSNITNMLHEPAVKAVVFNFEDVTEHIAAEEQLVHANRLYAFVSQINHAIAHIADEHALFTEACNVALEYGKFSMAWAGLFNKDERKITLVAQSGMPAEDIALFSAAYAPEGPQEQVRKVKDFYVCNDVQRLFPMERWKRYASVRGVGSFMVLPIRRSGQIVGTFNLYAAETGFFNKDEVKLLNGIAADISYALDVFEKENLRKIAEQRLKQSEARLLQGQSMAHFGNWSLSFATGLAIWSDEACRIYGLPLEENVQTYEGWVSFLHPEDLEYVIEASNIARESFSSAAFHHRIVLRDGTVKHIYSQSHYEFDENKRPIGMYGVAHDITEQKAAEVKIINANRLYSFISGINQTIVHVKDEQTLFNEACRIATTSGEFALAWIGVPDQETGKLHLAAHGNANPDDLASITEIGYNEHGPVADVLRNSRYYLVNDLRIAPGNSPLKQFAMRSGFQSSMILPIKKSGQKYGTLNLFSYQADLFDAEEIRLLEEVVGDISFALDVFEKERARAKSEKDTAHSQLRLKQAQSIAHVGSWEFQFSAERALWSDEHCKIYGLAPEDNMHTLDSWLSFIHPDDKEAVIQAISNPDASFRNSSINHRIIRRDGSVRHIYAHSQFEFTEAGEQIGLYGVSHDITESKEAQESLVQSEANLRMIIDLIPQSIFVKDFDGRYVFVNKTFASLHGMTPKELVNKSHLEPITVKEEAQAILKQDQEVMLTGVTKVIPEMPFTNTKGETRIYYTVKVPYKPARKNLIGVLGIANDITEEKRVEVERAKMIADIMQRNKDLQQFSYIVSHNLRAPVANILGITEVIQFLDPLDEEMKNMTESLAISTRKLDTVIKDLNLILQIRRAVNENREIVYFADLVEDIKKGIENIARIPEITIVTNFSGIEKMFCLKSYIYSIFFNLISNSIKYRRPGVQTLIEIESEIREDKTCLVFRDNGLGINLEKNSSMLFGLYKRFHQHVEGKGIGLYMVKTQVEALGGTIKVSSELNKGTEFIIEFENN